MKSLAPRSLRRLATVDEYLAAPIGAYVARPHVAIGCVIPSLFVTRSWGHPEEDDAAWACRVWPAELLPSMPPHASLMDFGEVESVPPGVFQRVAEYQVRHWDALTRQLTRMAIVRPEGVTGAVVAGFFGVVTPPYPTRVFPNVPDALAWLSASDALEAVQSLEPDRETDEVLVRRVRAYLAAHLRDATPEGTARAMGLSERTLSRRLQRSGTTLQTELNAVRVEAAQELLLRRAGAKLSVVADEVGCATPSHFSTLFRRVTGESPREWRRRNRG